MTNETSTATTEQTARNFDLLLDIPLEVTVELGRTRLALRELLALGAGSVIELGKLAGEPLDVLVNGKLVARGECVMVNDKFGVRLTDIVSRSERLARLG
jgi:flagellar motor switch protein FliN/FliY